MASLPLSHLVNPLNTTVEQPPVFTDLVEYAEVPEGRTVHGHDMVFHAPVYGELVSDGGTVALENTLGWGSVINPAGRITSGKRAFNATLQAPGGTVEIARAESCLIIGRDVTLHEAVKCQIFAHTLRIGTASGCMIAGRHIDICQAKPYKHEPTMITMVVPDMPNLDETLHPIRVDMADMAQQVAALSERIDAWKADVALTHYLSIRAKVRAGMIALSDEQAQSYVLMEQRLEETAQALEASVAERRPVARALAAATAHVDALHAEQAARLADCRCDIARVSGETIVRQLLEAHDDPDLSLIPLPMIPKILFNVKETYRWTS